MSDKIWLSPPHMSGEELKYVQEAYDMYSDKTDNCLKVVMEF